MLRRAATSLLDYYPLVSEASKNEEFLGEIEVQGIQLMAAGCRHYQRHTGNTVRNINAAFLVPVEVSPRLGRSCVHFRNNCSIHSEESWAGEVRTSARVRFRAW